MLSYKYKLVLDLLLISINVKLTNRNIKIRCFFSSLSLFQHLWLKTIIIISFSLPHGLGDDWAQLGMKVPHPHMCQLKLSLCWDLSWSYYYSKRLPLPASGRTMHIELPHSVVSGFQWQSSWEKEGSWKRESAHQTEATMPISLHHTLFALSSSLTAGSYSREEDSDSTSYCKNVTELEDRFLSCFRCIISKK